MLNMYAITISYVNMRYWRKRA